MTNHVTSADGTRIAFEQRGSGPPLIIVGGILGDRERDRPLAQALAGRFTVISYDRRGRGESTDTLPYAVQREVEDIAALIAHAGFKAAVYGHSSGAGLALNAAASGLPITRLILHEPPYGPDDEQSQKEARELAESVRAALEHDRPSEAIKLFFTAAGMPEQMVEWSAADPKTQDLAGTMLYDFEVMGDFTKGGTIPESLVRAITVPTLVLAGGASPDFFRDTAQRVAALLPNARHELLPDQDHGASPEAVAPAVTTFLS
jgi:pimeloyl-ACP methyl ester carboxylesterase